jgi:hypothetical protein
VKFWDANAVIPLLVKENQSYSTGQYPSKRLVLLASFTVIASLILTPVAAA